MFEVSIAVAVLSTASLFAFDRYLKHQRWVIEKHTEAPDEILEIRKDVKELKAKINALVLRSGFQA